MSAIADPTKEEARAAIVERIRRSGLPSEAVLAGYCRTAAALFRAPIAFFSLVATRNIFFVSQKGLPTASAPRDPGLCSTTIMQTAPLLIADARAELEDTRNGLVDREPGIRFYAGAPIRVDGFGVGAIAVADPNPRSASPQELSTLEELGRLAGAELEQNLRSAEDAVERLRRAKREEVKSWFSYGLSHEYTNALTGAMALCETLERSPPSMAPALLIKLQEAHTRMAQLTRTFILFQEGAPRSAAPLDVNSLVDSVATLMQYVVNENIEFTVDLNRSLTGVEAETRGIDFPVALLLVRARNAMEGNGALTVATGLRALARGWQTDFVDLPPGDYVTIAITDTGRPPTHKELDGLSGSLDLALVTDSEATNLWLAQDFVNRIGGQIDLTTGSRGATSLTVYLPVLKPVPQNRFQEARTHLLVVEDAGLLAEALQSALSRAGYRVSIASRGDEAFRGYPDATVVDLLIADVLVPGMNGIDLARRLRETNPDLPVILISGQTDCSHFEPDELLRGALFLQKPFSMEALLLAVNQLLGSGDLPPA